MHIYFMYKWHMEVKTAWKIALLWPFASNSLNGIFIVCSLIKPEKDILMYWLPSLNSAPYTTYLNCLPIFYDYIYLTFPTAAAELFPETSWCSKLMSALHIIDRTAPYQMKWWYSSYRTSSKGYASILYSHILTLLVIYTIYSPTEKGKQNYFLYLDRANW